jgi:hypothetical protein
MRCGGWVDEGPAPRNAGHFYDVRVSRDDATETVTSILWLEVDSLCAHAAVGLPMAHDEDPEPFLNVLAVARAVLC